MNRKKDRAQECTRKKSSPESSQSTERAEDPVHREDRNANKRSKRPADHTAEQSARNRTEYSAGQSAERFSDLIARKKQHTEDRTGWNAIQQTEDLADPSVDFIKREERNANQGTDGSTENGADDLSGKISKKDPLQCAAQVAD